MANAIKLSAETREKLGTRTTRRLRNAGKLPAIVYGHGEAPLAITVPTKAFFDSLNQGAHLFELGIGSKAETVLLRDVQFDHLGTNIIHADFARVDLNERVTVTIGIELIGTPIGEKDGGKLQQTLNEIEIEALVTEIPDAIHHDVSGMKLDDALHVSELTVPSGVKVLTDGDSVVAVLHAILEDASTSDNATAPEPEVIKKEKPAEEAEAKK
jgi:large subunit ribosomal protein L25